MRSMNILYDKADLKTMSPITQKLDALLKADGYSLLGAGRRENEDPPAGSSYAITARFVNQLVYIREGERVFLTTHENPKDAAQIQHEHNAVRRQAKVTRVRNAVNQKYTKGVPINTKI